MKLSVTSVIAGLSITCFSCKQIDSNSSTSNVQRDQAMTKPVENIAATQEQRERRLRSEEICRSRSIPIYPNPNSLFVETDEKTTIRTKDEIVDRALALCYIGLKGEGLDQVQLDQMDRDYAISSKLTPAEKVYAAALKPTSQQKTDAIWRYESLHILLWALGYTDTLNYPDKICNVGEDVKVIYELKERGFRQNARLRSKKEILDEADLILRLHWACVEARQKGIPAPGGLDDEIIFERHQVLNWLIRYMNQDWDDVATDT